MTANESGFEARRRVLLRRLGISALALGVAALAAAPAVAGAWGSSSSDAPVVRACDPPDQDGPSGPVDPNKPRENPVERPKIGC